MQKFSDIIGHEKIIEHFQGAIKFDRVSHAYILNGEEGSGKRMLAGVFAAALECERHGTEPCGECHSCKQAESGNQPDIIWVQHEKSTSIGVEDVRERVIGDIQIKPYNNKYKIYIVDEAEKLTQQAQNALLKTIEEPPSYGVIMLLTTNAEAFLPTISSRCVKLNLKPIEDKKIRRYLMDVCKIPDYKAEVCVAFAQGNLGKGIQLARSESFEELKQHLTRTMRNIGDMELSELLTALKELDDFKVDISIYLDLMLVWFRDVLLYKVAKDINELIFREEISSIAKQGIKSSYEGIEEILTAIEKAKVRLKANVNFDLVMELLLLTIKENIR